MLYEMPHKRRSTTLVEAIASLLRDLVAERTGIFVDDNSVDIFMDKLSPLMLERGLVSPLDYYYLLKYDNSAAEEWRRITDTISTRETYFWREFEQIRTLVEHIIPRYFSRPQMPRPRIWSAACASGEEPLTIAMAIREAGLYSNPIEILASDASPTAVATAQRGVYRERSFRNLEPQLRNRYFTKVENGWKANREIDRMHVDQRQFAEGRGDCSARGIPHHFLPQRFYLLPTGDHPDSCANVRPIHDFASIPVCRCSGIFVEADY